MDISTTKFNLRFDEKQKLYHADIKGILFTFSRKELETIDIIIQKVLADTKEEKNAARFSSISKSTP